MYLCVQVEVLRSHLSTLAPLIDKYQRGDMDFSDQALVWLEEAEKSMSSLHLSRGSEMSSLRGSILGAADALLSRDEYTRRGQIRKARALAAVESLRRAEEIMRQDLLSAQERLKFFEDKLAEGMTAFVLQNSLPPGAGNSWLDQVWREFSQNESTRALASYIVASLSPYDRSYILIQVMERVSQNDLKHREFINGAIE